MEFENYILQYQNQFNVFAQEYGMKKVRTIKSIVEKSKHTQSLLNQSLNNMILPTTKDFGSCIMSNLRLSLSSTDKIRFATILLVDIWHNKVNTIIGLADDEKLVELLNSIKIKIN
ncbi:hypothetical protein EVU94_00825 [Flavobacteriaceae bacterium 144Ye]|nr:hypothetical protein EVU94_00825 [Flavobacteriaceae bacterium 144Ye]